MKKVMILFLAVIMLVMGTACEKQPPEEPIIIEPKLSQMKYICELSVMDCYYHNVAKYNEEDAAGMLWWKKDKKFWIEYSGVVKLGIDASLVNMEVNGTQVTITLPKAKVLGCKVDSASLTKASYIVDKNSADISAEDEIAAFNDAQNQLEENASNNQALLAEAQQRAEALLEDYVTNIGTVMGREYSIKWVYLDENGEPSGSSSSSQPVQSDTSSSTSVSA